MIRRLRPILILIICCLAACSKPESPSSFSVESGTLEVTAEGGPVTIKTIWENCKYFLSSDASFVSLPGFLYFGKIDGSGENTITINVAANTTFEPREARLVFSPVEGTGSGEISVRISQAGREPVKVTVTAEPTATFQTWDGFGAMNLGANWGKALDWSQSETDSFMGTLGLSIMRVRIPYNESSWGDLVEGCKYAIDKHGAIILASPWTMPAAMKEPQQLEAKSSSGVTSSLKRECYEEYALYLERFCAFMRDKGAPVYAVSIQNEPDWAATYEGCLWSADEHLAFVRDYGHLITSAKLVTGESMGFNHSFYDPALKDEKARANIDIVGGHLYGSVPRSYSLASDNGKPIWMTEHLLNDSWSKNTSHWAETMDMLKEIHGCLVNGWNAYIWWYGRRYYSLIGDGEQGTSKGEILQRGKAFGQYSAHIRPGDTRIGVKIDGAEGLSASGFKNSEGRMTIVILNPSAEPFPGLRIEAGKSFSSAEGSYTTENKSGSLALSKSGQILTLDLPASSVATIDIR